MVITSPRRWGTINLSVIVAVALTLLGLYWWTTTLEGRLVLLRTGLTHQHNGETVSSAAGGASPTLAAVPVVDLTKPPPPPEEPKKGEVAAGSEPNPPEGETKPPEEQNKPPEEQSKPPEEQSKPPEEQSKPPEDQNKPADEQNKPPEDQNKPSDEQNKPHDEQNKPPEQPNPPEGEPPENNADAVPALSNAATDAPEEKPEVKDDAYDCQNFKGAEDVLLVIKTGATEIMKKLPVHLLTTTRCVSDFIVFSSLEQDIAGVHVYDAIANISDAVKSKDDKLSKLYPKLQEYHRKALDLTDLAKEGSWDLDKWKNINMAMKVYNDYPKKKWFVFIDADTAIVWSNLVRMLNRMDAKKALYLGSEVFIGEGTFGHGGSGYVVSRPAMKKVADMFPEKKDYWEDRILTYWCCGDMAFAEALRDNGIKLKGVQPSIQGSTTRSTEYSSWNWCRAPVTFHHVSPEEIDELWKWEQKWIKEKGRDTPMTFGDMFYDFVGQHLLPLHEDANSTEPQNKPESRRKAWDNLSDHERVSKPKEPKEGMTEEETKLEPWYSADKCASRCKKKSWCIQWRWQPHKCWLGDKPILGRTPKIYWEAGGGESTDEMVSGWFADRIEHYVSKQGNCKEKDYWP